MAAFTKQSKSDSNVRFGMSLGFFLSPRAPKDLGAERPRLRSPPPPLPLGPCLIGFIVSLLLSFVSLLFVVVAIRLLLMVAIFVVVARTFTSYLAAKANASSFLSVLFLERDFFVGGGGGLTVTTPTKLFTVDRVGGKVKAIDDTNLD